MSVSEHIEDMLSAYLDDELTESERRQVEAHLAACVECRELLNDLQAMTVQVAAVYRQVQAPAGFESRVAQEIKPAVSADRLRRQAGWPAAAIGLIPLLLLVVIMAVAGSYLFKAASLGIKVGIHLLYLAGGILGSSPYLTAGLIGCSLVLILASGLSLRTLLKTNARQGVD